MGHSLNTAQCNSASYKAITKIELGIKERKKEIDNATKGHYLLVK